jgi:hypothetical protein
MVQGTQADPCATVTPRWRLRAHSGWIRLRDDSTLAAVKPAQPFRVEFWMARP